MIDLVSRAAWGARAPRGSYGRLTSTRGVKVHYTGGQVSLDIVNDHAKCVAMVKSIQAMHMDGNGWMDIGYSMVACPHRKVFEGRGPGRLPAANGPGLNGGHYAVLGLVGSSGLVTPPDAMLHGIRDAIEWLRAEGGAGLEIKGHRDGYSTSCPGGPLYAWVRAGAPRPDQEDDVSAKDNWDHEITVPWGSKENPAWKARSLLLNTNERLRAVQASLDAQNAAIGELVKALAERDEAVDVEALVARIEAAIERVQVRLDVGPAGP